MNKLDDEAPEGERRDAVQFLLDWAREPDGPTCCALLGSVGIGKTTTSKAFAHRLLQDRDADNTLPMPIYLDLRNLGEVAKASPDLKTILQTLLRWTLARWRDRHPIGGGRGHSPGPAGRRHHHFRWFG